MTNKDKRLRLVMRNNGLLKLPKLLPIFQPRPLLGTDQIWLHAVSMLILFWHHFLQSSPFRTLLHTLLRTLARARLCVMLSRVCLTAVQTCAH